jgi:hypothetical protein
MRLLWILLSVATATPCPQYTMYLIGSYRPQCDENGAWRSKQCWASTGACWCVDSEGERISKDTAPGVPLDCSTVASEHHN